MQIILYCYHVFVANDDKNFGEILYINLFLYRNRLPEKRSKTAIYLYLSMHIVIKCFIKN